MKQRRKSHALIALAVLAIFAMLLWSHPRVHFGGAASAADPALRDAKSSHAASKPEHPWIAAHKPEARDADDHTVKQVSLIGAIELEKTVACPGESVQLSMRKAPDATGPVRFTSPNGGDGNPAIVKFDEPGKHEVDVVASDGRGGVDYGTTQLEILEASSPECASKPLLAVSASISGIEEDTADIHVAAVGGLREPLSYTYEFGDGTNMHSTIASATHNYQLRSQIEPTSTFVIKVQARDAQGRTASGRASLVFTNVHWLSRTVGSPMVPVAYGRFPETHGAAIETDLTFRNIEDQPVKFATAEVTVDSCTGAEPQRLQYPANQVLHGVDTLPTGGVESTTLSLPAADVAGACRVTVVLAGDTVPPRAGTPIGQGMPRTFDTTRAQLALELAGPPLKGALAAAAPVEIADPGFAEKLAKAEQILGPGRPVTPEDLQRLAREGRLE
jgi:hypothetical protein